jgi:dipeptidyl aminopeptidase/acylaminoacyl peptidase
MSKKTLTILIIVFSVVIIVLFVAAFFLSRGISIAPGEDGERGPFGDFFPAEDGGGQAPVVDTGVGDPTETSVSGKEATALSELRQITMAPVAGAVLFSRDGKTYIRYLEKRTGNAYEADSTSYDNNRLTNTTIPGVAKALWNRDGSQVVIRYTDTDTDTVKNFGANINELKNTLEGAFLPDAMREITTSPSSDKIFYTLSFQSDTAGVLSNFDGAKTLNIFTSPFSEWLISWFGSKTIALATKPSFGAAGYLYFLNTQTEALDSVLGDIKGLTALPSPDGKQVLYSRSDKGGFTLHVFTRADKTATELPIRTLPEKCVWAEDSITLYCAAPLSIPAGEYPDIWYQGLVSFSDDIWKINTETGFIDLVVILEDEARAEIDVIEPMLSTDGGYLIFINKKDSLLWGLKL